MNTPICDYVNRYAEKNVLRLHMPGHKGLPVPGLEKFDITEIEGADSLFEARGIIRESEKNASGLFGCATFYSTGGSSQCVRAMLYLALLYAWRGGKRPLVAAARNAHRSFLSAAALLDFDISWLYPARPGPYLSCALSAQEADDFLSRSAEKPAALYLTSPDYLGGVADVRGIAEVCRRRGVPLLVDNAHGAYLRFLPESRHPMDLGADLCCDSAHKTLPVLTGGAYLHISDCAPAFMREQARNALALFGSTSPSYLILRSLDAANAYLAGDYPARLAAFARELSGLRERLRAGGYTLYGDEPLKLAICAKPYGRTGTGLAAALREKGVECEFADPDLTVMMLTPETGPEGLARLGSALLAIPQGPPVEDAPPALRACEPVMSVREAAFSPCETVPAAECAGRVLAAPSVSCPPAVPIAVCGERMDESSARAFAYYGIEDCTVVIE